MNILFLGSVSLKRNRLDGVTIKSRCLKSWIENQKNIDLILIDTDDWKKNFIEICFKFITNILNADIIVVSSAQRGANILFKILKVLRCKKDIYYFVAGGRLGKYLKQGIYDKKDYLNIKKIYVESNKMVGELESCGLNNVVKLLNFREFNFTSHTKLHSHVKFVFYSRVIKEKGVEDLIFAFNMLNKKYPHIRLDIYGQVDSSYLEYLKTIMNDNIKYKGAIVPNNDDEYQILSEYDVFVLPTYYEGECLPGALIDAYISGLAIIASDWEYAREYINDGNVGYIHRFRDREDLGDKMELMISNKEIIKKFKDNSKCMANLFNINNALEDFKQCLENR